MLEEHCSTQGTEAEPTFSSSSTSTRPLFLMPSLKATFKLSRALTRVASLYSLLKNQPQRVDNVQLGAMDKKYTPPNTSCSALTCLAMLQLAMTLLYCPSIIKIL